MENFFAPVFVIRLFDKYRNKLLTINNVPLSHYRINLKEHGLISLTLKNLNLTEGEYFVDFGFGQDKMGYDFDVEGVLLLEIKGKDVYHSGCVPNFKRGPIFIDHKWKEF